MQNDKKKVTASEVIKEKDPNVKEQKYNEYVKKMTPTTNKLGNLCKAFFVGGIICVIGEALIELFRSWGSDKDLASAYTLLILVGAAVLLTGLNIYPTLAKWAGAGTLVPITGFANSVAAPAVEFKKEGQVFGIGCKIFVISGPVILYGIFFSWVLGVIYYILTKMGIV